MDKPFAVALLWDIDGTLLDTGRAGIFALEDAAREVLGTTPNFAGLATAGLTDVEIAAGIVKQSGRPADSAVVDRFLRVYEDRLPRALPRKVGRVLPGVRAILEGIAARNDIFSMLLTGNTRAGARAKLTHYGIEGFFGDGAFSDSFPDRRSIARQALDMVRERQPDFHVEDIYVIGDTPHDIHCGKAIGSRTIAVASGQFGEDALRAFHPWWTIPRLPSPEEFFERVVLQAVRKGERS